jgi:hypothetical protein
MGLQNNQALIQVIYFCFFHANCGNRCEIGPVLLIQSLSKAIKLETALTSAQKVCQRLANLQLAGDMNRHLAEVVLPDEPKFSDS